MQFQQNKKQNNNKLSFQTTIQPHKVLTAKGGKAENKIIGY